MDGGQDGLGQLARLGSTWPLLLQEAVLGVGSQVDGKGSLREGRGREASWGRDWSQRTVTSAAVCWPRHVQRASGSSGPAGLDSTAGD